jgi:hypothetical protein
VKVLDFGLAAGTPEHAETGGPVAQTTLAGTPLYMAPEQARGEPIDFRADIYALGATLYQLVTGHPPFQGKTAAELRTQHESAERPSIPRGVVARTQSAALDALIARMMAPKPENRFASYDELLRAIELVSTQYTRPAGFWVRSIAVGVDLLLLAIVIGLARGLLIGDGEVPFSLYLIPALALYELLTVGRWGSTIGTALFELQITDVDTGGRPSWSSALKRMLLMFGPLIALGLIEIPLDAFDLHLLRNIARIAYAIVVVTWVVHLLYVAWRVPGKRTSWDRFSGTIVRYRR